MFRASAEPVEELEENVWSLVRQENEHEDQGEGAQNSGRGNVPKTDPPNSGQRYTTTMAD